MTTDSLGWICPRCGKVWSPLITHCDCGTRQQFDLTPPRPAVHCPGPQKTSPATLTPERQTATANLDLDHYSTRPAA